MQQIPITHAEVVDALCSADPNRRKAALQRVFVNTDLRESVIRHVCRFGGNRQDGEDVFQESVILFDRKIREGHYRADGTLEAFFMGIARWQWYNLSHQLQRKQTLLVDLPAEPGPGGNPELDFLLKERREALGQMLEKLTEKCRNILKMYQLDYSMEEVSRAMGYANGEVAKKESFLCRQRLKTLLQRGWLAQFYHEG